MTFDTIRVKVGFPESALGNDREGYDLTVTRDLVEGYAIQHISSLDHPCLTLSGVQRAWGTLWFGNVQPTTILSRPDLWHEAHNKIHPTHRRWIDAQKRAFMFNGGWWWPSLIRELADGWIVILNENHPLEPRLNGCFFVSKSASYER
jgi:hypothetical protein